MKINVFVRLFEVIDSDYNATQRHNEYFSSMLTPKMFRKKNLISKNNKVRDLKNITRYAQSSLF